MKHLIRAVILLAFAFPAAIFAQPPLTTSAEQAQVVTSDLENFLEAYRRIEAGGNALETLEEHYFGKASPGLKEYVARFRLTPEQIANAVSDHPDKYRDLARFHSEIDRFKSIYRAHLKRYKSILPGARFAPTYLLVGAFRGIGQASRVGQLVTIEKTARDLQKLTSLAIHEVTHFQQALSLGMLKYTGLYRQEDNMLGLVLREGAAEFVTYKLIGRNEHEFARLGHLRRNEFALWERFREDLKSQNKQFWLEVTFDDDNKGYPYLLGYAMGYRIIEAYFDRENDKTKALRDILAISDPEAFVVKSGYQPRLTKLQKEFLFGRPAPSAPEAIKSYRELIGVSDCVAQLRKADGSWSSPLEMVWTFKYVLGGLAVQDEARRSDGFRAGSLREYSEKEKRWYVRYFSSAQKVSRTLPTWTGKRAGNEIVLTMPQKAPNGANGFYNIRFYNISAKGFDWLGSWTSSDGSVVFENRRIGCRKREM